MSGLRVGFAVSGQGRLFREAVRRRNELGIVPSLLIADHAASPDLEALCSESAVPFVRLEADERSAQRQIRLAFSRPGMDLFSLTFDRILPGDLSLVRDGRVINVHPALLPSFRGRDALARAAQADVRFAGASVHVVTEAVDRGPIIAQCVVPTAASDDAEVLGGRLYSLLRLMYLQVLRWYAEGRVETDSRGRVRVRGATYGTLPINPAVEAELSEGR